jgi:hypothetical protein
MSGKKILVATLNWGLGHSTRCIPLIRALISQGHSVFLASDGMAGRVLKQDFPELPYLELPGYDITYPSRGFYHHWIRQLPGLHRAIAHEQKSIREMMRQYRFEVLISDNRYGVFHPQSQNILITHQLNIPLAPPIARVANRLLQNLVNRFDQCWIPDFPGENNLSGDLSRGRLKIQKQFIGPMSRFVRQESDQRFDLCLVLSGPEPYRTLMQNQLQNLLSTTPLKLCWILGLPGETVGKAVQFRGEVYNHLPSNRLNEILNASALALGRSGYSSIMDYYTLHKKAILIPTPFQPEQQYLARRHRDDHLFFVPKPDLTDLPAGIQRLLNTKVGKGEIVKMSIPSL